MTPGADGRVTIELGRSEALVLSDLLFRMDDDDRWSTDPVERHALWRLSGALERTLAEPLRPDWHRTLEAARDQLRRAAGA